VDFSIRSAVDPPTVILDISGELDIFSAQQVSHRLDEAIQAGCRFVVADVGRVGFVDASGLGMLHRALRRVESHEGSLQFVAVSDTFRRVCGLTGLDTVFQLPPPVTGSAAPEPVGA